MIDQLIERLERIETVLEQLLSQRTVRDWYSTADVAQLLGRAEYTVREWCRKGQVPAEKAANGRGWLLSHATLTRLLNRELPCPEHQPHRVLHG